MGGLKERTSKFLCERGFRGDDKEARNLLETIEYCEVPYQQLRNSYQQEKYFVNSGFFIRPIEVPIALGYFPHHNRTTGHVEELSKPITTQYVPIHKRLKCIFDSKNFMSTVLQYQCSNDRLLRDFYDGQFCKEHNFFTNGLDIDSDVFNGTVRVSIAQVSGDNLGVNGIC